jgi:WD40 repeat protein
MNGLFVFNTAGTLLWTKPLPITESYDGDWRGADSKTVGVSADGSYIVAATMTGLYLYDNLGTLIWNFMGTTGPVETIARISPDGRNIVAANYNTGEIHFFSHLRNGVAGWSAADGTPVWTKQIGGGFNWAAIDGSGRYAAFTGDVDGDNKREVSLFDRSGVLRWSFELNRAGFARVDMPWDGRSVVAVNADPADLDGSQLVYFSDMKNGIMGWGIGDGTPQWVFTPSPDGGTNDFYSVAISPNGDVISTGPASTNIYLLSNTGAPLQTIANGVVNALDLTFTGEYGVAGDRVEPNLTGTIRYFSRARNMLLWSFATQGKINSVAIQKKYPCMEPFPYHDVDVSNVTRYTTPDGKVKTIVCQGYPANEINITLSNHGNYFETVEVTLYAYSSPNNTMVVVGNASVTIAPGTNPVISITWNSTNVPYYGNYTLYATIGPVRNENNLTDNEFIDSGLVVTGVGDVSGDRTVNIVDVSLAAKAFGTVPGNPRYNPNADINCDYTINIVDVSIAAKNFGKNYP